MEFNNKWKEYILYELADWKNGLAFKDIYFSSKGKPVIKIAELKNGITEQTKFTEGDYGEEVYLRKNDLIFSWSGNPKTSIDAFLYDLPDGYLNQHSFKITEKKEIINKYFLYYILKYLNPLFQSIATDKQTTGLGHVTVADLKKIKVRVPTLQEQNKFLDIIKNIDDKIYTNNKINDNLYNQAVAIYKDRFQNTNQEICSIGDYLVPRRGKNLLSRDAILGDVPVIAGGLEPATYHNASNTKAPVITISASGANAGYINLWNVPVWSSDSSYIDNDITENVYFWYVTLKTRQKEIFDAQTGSAQPHIYPQHIAELPINKLENEDVFKYEKQVEPLFKMIGKNKEENKYLEQLRDTLLPKLMNGEIDLDKIEI